MKRIIISLLLIMSISTAVYADTQSPRLHQAIRQYKSGNYTGSLQSLQKVIEYDPGNSLAHYYLGMCYAQIGDKDKADSEYNKVISLSPSSELARNATLGKTYLDPQKLPSKPAVQQSTGFLSDKAKGEIQDKNIKNIMDNINKNKSPNPAIYQRMENFDPANSKSSNDKPTQEEISAAMQTLSKAGLNTANLYNQTTQNTQANSAQINSSQINPELMQMNMLMSAFGNNGNNSMYGGGGMNNMMPLLMMMQNGQGNQKVDPETIQVMMSSMMMPNMMNLYDNHNNDN